MLVATNLIPATFYGSTNEFYSHCRAKLQRSVRHPTNFDLLITLCRLGDTASSDDDSFRMACLTVSAWLACPAAKLALIDSFNEDTTREAVQIFRSDSSVRW
jgi:hypothetical protein